MAKKTMVEYEYLCDIAVILVIMVIIAPIRDLLQTMAAWT